jgi:hypothetical protein
LPSAEGATDLRVPHPPGFPVRLGGVNELHAAFLIESRTRCQGWGRAVGNPGSFALFAKGGIPRISIPRSRIPPFAKNAKDGAPAYSWCFPPCQTPMAAQSGLVSYQSSTGVAGPRGHETGLFLISTSRSKSCPQGLKPIVLASFMYGLKPVPFETEGLSATCLAA